MLQNYLKIAIRNLVNNKVLSFINIAGLAVGMAVCLLIVLFIKDELHFDTFFKKTPQIYQVNIDGNFGGSELLGGYTPPPAGKTLMAEFPEIETYTRTFQIMDLVVSHEQNGKKDHFFDEKNIMAVDSNFLEIFDFALQKGNATTCLQNTDDVVITETMAKKYFGDSDPINQVLLFGERPRKVTAVLKDIPSQSSMQFDFLVPIRSVQVVNYFDWSWVWLNVSTFVVLNDKIAQNPERIRQLEAKFPTMIRKHAQYAFNRIGQPYDEFIKKGGKWEFFLQPFQDVHLHSGKISVFYENTGDIKQVYMFGIIAIFIILLACVNFMNLSTARSLKRAKEVGVRKTLGSFQCSLIKQFLSESLLYSFLATVLALVIISVSLPWFNQISGKAIAFNALFEGGFGFFIVLLMLTTGVLAGSYPAFYLTSFKPIEVLKTNSIKTGIAHLLVRNGLVVFQFAVSTALIICTIVVFQQLRFTQNKDLGLTKENVIVIPNAQRLEQSQEAFRQEIARLPNIIHTSISTNVPLSGGFGDFYLPEQHTGDKQIAKDLTLYSFMTDDEFIKTLDIKLTKGRDFSQEFNDSTSVILNEAAVKKIGWKNPIGKYIDYPGGNMQRFKVVGVVKDFDVQTVHNVMSPFALFHHSSKTYQESNSYVLARISGENVDKVLTTIEKQWKSYAPGTPFTYTFLDESFAKAYQREQRTGVVFGIFTGLAILIACLGLFGLIAYMAETKTKEIGIRKVMGASVSQIIMLLSRGFLKLVIVSFAIAAPAAWWAMSQWLTGFAYPIDISWWMYAVAGSMALLIAIFTVSFQAVKAALMNPVISLKSE